MILSGGDGKFRRRGQRSGRVCPFLGGRVLQVVRPQLHQAAALLEKVRAAIGGFHLVWQLVGQRLVRNLLGEVGCFRRPIGERRTEAVNGHARDPVIPQKFGHGHIADRPFPVDRKHKTGVADAFVPSLAEKRHGGRREGNDMGFARFHPFAGNGPDGIVQIELGSDGKACFVRPDSVVDGEAQGIASSGRRCRHQPLHERRNISIGHGFHMAALVALARKSLADRS